MWDKRDWPSYQASALMIQKGDGRECTPIYVDGIENKSTSPKVLRFCGRVNHGSTLVQK